MNRNWIAKSVGISFLCLSTLMIHLLFAAEEDEVKKFEGTISRVEGRQLTLLVGEKAMTFEVNDTTAIDLDGTPVTVDRLAMAHFANIDSIEQSGTWVAKKITARTKKEPPK